MSIGPKLSYLIGNAVRTFERTRVLPEDRGYRLKLTKDEFTLDVELLLRIMGSITARDLCLHKSPTLNEINLDDQDAAPVTYIDIYGNRDISVGIFIIRRGCKIPLHDHPGMHGLIRVLHGIASINTYTRTSIDPMKIPKSLESKIDLIHNGILFPAKKVSLQATISSPVIMLTPEEGNIHEISAGPDSPLAILDVLSPPYNDGTQIPDDFPRPCHYYEEFGDVDHRISATACLPWLQILPDVPEGHFTDTEMFEGSA